MVSLLFHPNPLVSSLYFSPNWSRENPSEIVSSSTSVPISKPYWRTGLIYVADIAHQHHFQCLSCKTYAVTTLKTLNRVEDHVDRPGYHTAIHTARLVIAPSLYRVRLAAIAHTIAEHQPALSLQRLLDQWQSRCLEERILRSRRAKHSIEGIYLRWLRGLIGSREVLRERNR